MKKYIVLALISLALFSCTEKGLGTYETDDRYVYFTPLEDNSDSVSISFYNYPLNETIDMKIGVGLVGNLLAEDTPFHIEVIDTLTTAPKANYRLEQNPKFKQNAVKDTIVVTLVRTDDLKENVQITLQIVPNENFVGSVLTNRRMRIVFNNVASKPLWWDKTIDNLFLGPYSPEKLTEFIIATGVNDMTGMDFTTKRYYALIFKKAIEDKGLDMEVPIN